MTTKIRKHPKKRVVKKRKPHNIIHKGKGRGINGKVQVTGDKIQSRMVRVDVRLANLLALKAGKYGGMTAASRALYDVAQSKKWPKPT